MATLTSALVWEAIRKDVIGFERVSGLPVAESDSLEVDGLPTTGNERYRAGKGPGLDIALERGVEPGQPGPDPVRARGLGVARPRKRR